MELEYFSTCLLPRNFYWQRDKLPLLGFSSNESTMTRFGCHTDAPLPLLLNLIANKMNERHKGRHIILSRNRIISDILISGPF